MRGAPTLRLTMKHPFELINCACTIHGKSLKHRSVQQELKTLKTSSTYLKIPERKRPITKINV
jgi:hypothetical protein